ncbi:mariner Mos1 transposase [Trichonephila clavipes]|uniref:Mariner Mos1 transposase n=1 Tax=Trichonephila clavipes TaxID=2585209 RepID=A0A8X7BM97_TRICX|nr:mariner Mos1 transposase [Trichonephila clavipes]
MDDNARPHRTLAVEELLESEDITQMDWPAYSPDLNPIEYARDALGRRIAARLHHPENTQQLKQMLIEEWVLLPQEMLHQLVLSMRRWCEATLVVRGGLSEIGVPIFRARRQSVGDDQSPGQANTVIMSNLIDKVEDLVCAAWVPKQLTDQQKELRMGLTLQYLFRYQEDPSFMKRIVTGDETWCHHYEPETKRDIMQWKHASSPTPKKFRAVKSAGKVLLTVFFDVQGPLLVEFLEHNKSVNSDVYCETLQRLRRCIRNKRPGLLTEGVVLLHDNARPHVSRVTQMELEKFKWETLDHPTYCPDMSPCDFNVFGPLKKHLKGKRFNSNDVLKDTVKDRVSSQTQEFWEQKESCGLFISGIGVLKPMVYILNKVYICTHRVVSYLFI